MPRPRTGLCGRSCGLYQTLHRPWWRLRLKSSIMCFLAQTTFLSSWQLTARLFHYSDHHTSLQSRGLYYVRAILRRCHSRRFQTPPKYVDLVAVLALAVPRFCPNGPEVCLTVCLFFPPPFPNVGRFVVFFVSSKSTTPGVTPPSRTTPTASRRRPTTSTRA